MRFAAIPRGRMVHSGSAVRVQKCGFAPRVGGLVGGADLKRYSFESHNLVSAFQECMFGGKSNLVASH